VPTSGSQPSPSSVRTAPAPDTTPAPTAPTVGASQGATAPPGPKP
jgi:hypothetical protein